ncbi:glycosyl transferase [Bacteroidia bacterium]|nr:glycosyl transferase [Bacteroidia bacterium]GHT48389.1 glycosyl transferase [Bacteroidia bacterium]
MVENLLISVIIPLYNKEESILKTVNSVLNQTYPKFELLIINDGSTDNSVAQLNSISDNRVLIINQPNMGVSAARNTGIQKASSDYILFLDADDMLLDNALTVLSSLVLKYPNAQIYTSDFYIESEITHHLNIYCKCLDERIIKSNYKEYWLKKYCIRTGNTIFRKDILYQCGLFDVGMNYFEDLAFNMRLLNNSVVVYNPSPTFVYSKEFSTLSNGPKDLTKTFAYYLDLNHKSFWHKMILAMCLHSTMRTISSDRYNNRDYKVLKKKYIANLGSILLSRILIKLQ